MENIKICELDTYEKKVEFINYVKPLFPKGKHPLAGQWVDKNGCVQALCNLLSLKNKDKSGEFQYLEGLYNTTCDKVYKAIEWARNRKNCSEKWDVISLKYMILRVKDFKTKEVINNSPLASILDRYDEYIEDKEIREQEERNKTIRFNSNYGTI